MAESELEDFNVLKLKAKHLLSKSEWNAAKNILLELNRLSPHNVVVHTKLGKVYAELDDLDQSKLHYNKVTKMESNLKDFAYFNLAKIYIKQQCLFEAKRAFEQSLKIDSKKAVTHFHFATLLNQMGYTRMAYAHFQRACALKPKVANYHFSTAKTALQCVDIDNIHIDDHEEIIHEIHHHFIKAIELSNRQQTLFLMEYIIHWKHWNFEYLSIQETLQYLYFAAKLEEPEPYKQEYIKLCIFLVTQKDESEYDNKYIAFATQLDPNNPRILYEKHKMLDKRRCEEYHIDGMSVKDRVCDHDEAINNKTNPYTTFQRQCELLIAGFMNESIVIYIPSEIQYLCYGFFVGDYPSHIYYDNTISLGFTPFAQNECISMLFDVLCDRDDAKTPFIITKILELIKDAMKASPSMCCLCDERINYQCIMCENHQSFHPIAAHYISLLLSFMDIIEIVDGFSPLKDIWDKYSQQLIYLPTKLITSTRNTQHQSIAYDLLIKMAMVFDSFRSFHGSFRSCDVITPLLHNLSYFDASLNTFRYIVPRLDTLKVLSLFKIETKSNISIYNIKALVNVLCGYTQQQHNHSFGHTFMWKTWFNWLQSELNELDQDKIDEDLRNQLKRVMHEFWIHLETQRRLTDTDCRILKVFINKNIPLKPSTMGWNHFYQIISMPLITFSPKFLSILLYYALCQTNKADGEHWKHCVGILQADSIDELIMILNNE